MRVPFLDLAAAYAELAGELESAALRVMRSAHYVLGPEVEEFEREFAEHEGARHCVAVANGLDALTLALRALGIGPGDEVITPGFTFIATWLAVSNVGATIVPVESAADYTIDVDAVAAAITPRTKAVLPVHLYGQPAAMDELLLIAERHALAVIADAAQAQGARCKGRPIGNLGHAVAYSFYPGKNLGALGDAGAVTTDDTAAAERLRKLRNYGSSQKYVHELQGINSRMDELQAALLRVKLRHLDAWNGRRSALAERYNLAFDGTSLQLPLPRIERDPVWHLYVVRHHERDRLRSALADRGVDTLIHYPTAPYRQGAYRDTALGSCVFPNVDRFHGEVLSLPMGPHVTAEQAEHVVNSVLASIDC